MTTTARKMTGILFAAALALLTSVVLPAAEQVERKVAVVLDLGDEVGVLDLDFLPSELPEGESRTVTNTAGETMQMTRRDDAVVIIASDGSETVLPAMPAPDEGHTWVEKGDSEMEVEVIMGQSSDGLFISSATPLDEETRETIRSALQAAGITRSVEFMEPGMRKVFIHEDSEEGPAGEVRIIKKIQVIQEAGEN
ncbi:MAG: hypothetical protein OEM03_00315 [Chromatiales bacterium]|nr:hypothetical protein [Chromatiales bacterium]